MKMPFGNFLRYCDEKHSLIQSNKFNEIIENAGSFKKRDKSTRLTKNRWHTTEFLPD